MADPDIAIVFTPETWVEELHRFFTDHGGARVRQLIVDPAIAIAEDYAILVVSWRWPSLTRGLVEQLHEQGRRVLGVGDDSEPASRSLLESCGVDAAVSFDAAHHEFLEALTLLQSDPVMDGVLGFKPTRDVGSDRERFPLLALAGPAGVGTTEVAIALARSLRGLLVDCDEVAPAVAVRLGLPIEPNLRTAIDAAEFGLGEISDCIVHDRHHGLGVITGLPNVASWSQIRATEVMRTLRTLARDHIVVADTSACTEDIGTATRGRYAVTRAVLGEADAVVVVGRGTPLGVVRLLSWIADVQAMRPGTPMHIVLNCVPGDRFRRTELVDEISRTFEALTMWTVPDDRKVEAAAWSGCCVRNGAFTKVIGALGAHLQRSVGNTERPAPPMNDDGLTDDGERLVSATRYGIA